MTKITDISGGAKVTTKSLTNQLIITMIGADRPGIIAKITKVTSDAGCSLVDIRLNVYGREFVTNILLDGNWNSFAKLEAALPAFETSNELTTIVRRTEERKFSTQTIAYMASVIGVDKLGTLSELTNLFAEFEISISELVCSSYAARYTATPMMSLNITLEVPADTDLSELRDRFLDLCDTLNVDGILEPDKL